MTFFFWEIQNMWVGRTTLNGEKEGMALGSEAPTKKYKNTARRERWRFAQTKGGKMLHVAYRDWQEHFMCLNLTNQLLPRH